MYKLKYESLYVIVQKHSKNVFLKGVTEETFYMSQINPKEFVHNTAYSVQLTYIAGHSL